MKVIGIDPGYDRLGAAVLLRTAGEVELLHSECIETNRDDALPTRLGTIGKRFEALIAEHKPDAAAVETLFFNKNQKTAVGVLQARGAILYLAESRGLQVFEYGPQEIKLSMTGYGKSDKEAVTDMIKRTIAGAPASALDDEYDAIAVGATCLFHTRAVV